MYREHGEDAKIFGALVLMATTILLLGLAVVVGVFGFRGLVEANLDRDPLAASLLLVLIVLAPVGALDSCLVSLFAVFSGARAIFFRRHVLGPLLKLAATAIVVATHGDIHRLAWGMVVAGTLGTGIYAVMLVRLLARQGILERRLGWRHMVPRREIISFALPLFGSDMVFFLRSTLVVMLLQHFKDATEVASYQAVVPVARLALVVRDSFAFLYVPMAARLLARGDRHGIEDLYWNTTSWITMLCFPVFIATFVFSEPITLLVFGERYASSSRILALLALGQFLNTAGSTSVLTLRALGKIRILVGIDVAITILSLCLNFVLIPRWGALGAAIATGTAFVVHSLLNQTGLWVASRISLVRRSTWRFHVSIVVTTLALGAIQVLFHPPLYLGVPLALVAVAAVGLANRHLLDVAATFPQVRRIAWLRRLFPPLDAAGPGKDS
jgi:O-antigen/teichoic acid export membrane protein